MYVHKKPIVQKRYVYFLVKRSFRKYSAPEPIKSLTKLGCVSTIIGDVTPKRHYQTIRVFASVSNLPL